MKKYKNLFNKIVEPEHLFNAWDEFKSNKRSKVDVQLFEKHLEENIFELSRDLKNKNYKHIDYEGFYINDPKRRHIHKASVRDRILHHAIFQALNPIFEETFIPNSFSCRVNKGTHKGVLAVKNMLQKVSKNNTKRCYALKCDIQKFFDTVDHSILFSIFSRRIRDQDTLWLLKEIISGYESRAELKIETERERERERESLALRAKGIPIGNLTSQLFANVYMNEFDQFVKHTLKVKYYARYTDDFLIISHDKKYLESLLEPIQNFLKNRLLLTLHPKKIEIRKYTHGIDFLGYVILPHYQLIRKRTWKRMLRNFKTKAQEYQQGNISKERLNQSLQSYLGALSHANTYKVSQDLRNIFWF